MKKAIWITFFALVALTLVSAHAQDRSINEIITKNWERWIATHPQKGLKERQEANILHEHNCIHDRIVQRRQAEKKKYISEHPEYVEQIERKQREYEQKKSTTQKKSTFSNMRFYVDDSHIQGQGDDARTCYSTSSTVQLFDYDQQQDVTYQCTSDDIASDQLLEFIRDLVMPTLTEVFTEVILVDATIGNFTLDAGSYAQYSDCDDDLPIPASYVSPGVPNADYIVFVTARPDLDKGVVAYAGACNAEQISATPERYGRPLAGGINFCPRYIIPLLENTYTSFEFAAQLKVAIHELTHALGFSSDYYSSYTDSVGNFYTSPTASFQRTGSSPSGSAYDETITMLTTPEVVAYIRDHTGCSALTGVELEDFGGSGTAGSHWERRMIGDEYMTGYVNPSMPVSGLTLSLFLDMGWYQVVKSQAEYYGWGKDEGCSFVQQRCESAWPTASDGYWCSSKNVKKGCSPDRKSKAACNVIEYSGTLPAYYQHFSDATLGGNNQAADFCPFYEEDPVNPVYCVDASKQYTADDSLFEYFGDHSACWEIDSLTGKEIKCWQYKCVSQTQLQLVIDDISFDCPENGGDIDIKDAIGNGATTSCPRASLLCREVQGFATDNVLVSVNGTWEYSGSSVNTPSKIGLTFLALLWAAIGAL